MTTRKEAEKLANQVAREVKARVPEDCQFALLIFGGTTDDGSAFTSYAANASRGSVVQAMQEFIEKVSPGAGS